VLSVLDVPGQVHGGLQPSPVVVLKVDLPLLNVVCVRSVRISGRGCSCFSGVLLKDHSPSLSIACVGSVRSNSGRGGQLSSGVLLTVDLPSLNVACAGSIGSTSARLAAVVRCVLER